MDAELQKKVVSAEKKNARLVEAFKKTSQDYREVVYQTLGYKLGKHYFHTVFSSSSPTLVNLVLAL